MTASTGYCILRPDKDKLDSRFPVSLGKDWRVCAADGRCRDRGQLSGCIGCEGQGIEDSPPAPCRAEAGRGDSGCGGRLAGQAVRGSRSSRLPSPIHVPRHIRRPSHQSNGLGGTNSWGAESGRFPQRSFALDQRNCRRRGPHPVCDHSRSIRLRRQEERALRPAAVSVAGASHRHLSWICRGNGNRRLVGTGVYPDRSSNHVCFPDTMIGVAISPEILAAAYLHNVWRTPRVRRQIERGARTTNGTYKVNQQLLSSVVFPVPPADLQHRFAAIAQSAEHQKARQRAHLAGLDTLFASLQSRAFRGDL